MTDTLSQWVSRLPMPECTALLPFVSKLDGVQPDGIEGIATRWNGAAGKLTEEAGRLKNAVGKVDNLWDGGSAQAFVTYMKQYSNAGTLLNERVGDVVEALNKAAGDLREARRQMAALCEEVTKAPKSELMAKANAAIDRAQTIVNNADGALSTAAKAIGEALKDRSPTFESIKAVSEQTWDDDGNVVKWVPGSPPPTTLQGGPGTSGGNGYTGANSNGANGGNGGAVATGGGAPPTPLTFAPGTATGDKIVQAARTHIGKPYVWGANGPNAFDCSGLVYYVLNQSGIKIGDTTAAGYQATGKPVSDPQPGDIVFFGQPASHVGVYIGDGRMIHAPRPGADVVEASVSADGRSVSYRRFTA